MAKFDYSKLAATALRLIEKYGRDLTFAKKRYPSDATKPWRGNQGSPPTVVCTGAVVDYQLAEIDGDHVKRGDKQCFTTLPEGCDDFTEIETLVDSLDNSSWRIIKVTPLGPGDTIVCYELQLRQ